MRKLWQANKVKMVKENIKSMKSHTQKEISLNGGESQSLNFET